MLSAVPVVAHFQPDATPAQIAAAERLAEEIRRERSELAADERFRSLVPTSLEDAGCLNLDDLSEIRVLQDPSCVVYLQDRARLRAADGDLVATTAQEVPGYEPYYRDQLGLGRPMWLRPEPRDRPLHIGPACWGDRQVRRTLVHALRAGSLRYVHPHMGTFGVWELAELLHEHSRRPVSVIAPPPALSRMVNNKVAFTDLASRLLGTDAVPKTLSAWNLVTLCRRIAELAPSTHMIGLKHPDSAGGDANVVLRGADLRDRPLYELPVLLHPKLELLQWSGNSELLIDVWETEVLSSPSVQTWIPPEPCGPPVLEGIYTQRLEEEQGLFTGSSAAHFPAELAQRIATSSWLLARVFQRLGYVGRCSFDAILVGGSADTARIEFVESNARWGGTSLPMTLINRLFGDWAQQPYAVQIFQIAGLSHVTFPQLLEGLADDLYDVRTGSGRLILMTPSRLKARSSIGVVSLAPTWEEARNDLQDVVPQRLAAVARDVAALRSKQPEQAPCV